MSTNDRKPSEQKFHQGVGDLTITDAIPVGISVLATDGTIPYVNSLTLDLIGLTLDEVKGKSLLERTCHPDDLDRILEQRRLGLSKGVPFELEMRLSPKKGGYRWYLSQYKPVIDERSGNIIRWYLTTTDIDDRKRAEEKLQQSENGSAMRTSFYGKKSIVLRYLGRSLVLQIPYVSC